MFDAVCGVLTKRGYLGSSGVTEPGRMLARIWTEADLLVAECIRRDVWTALSPAELAAAVSVVVYEARRDVDEHASVPYGPVGDAIDATEDVWAEVSSDEHAAGVELTREADLGFVWPIFRWAQGEPLSKVLASGHTADGDMPAGDFVRWVRQVLDLLGQIAEAVPTGHPLRSSARDAVRLVNRGIVAYSSIA
jgi:ATP-dependent RNA helicase HelY